ncbi:unnamed protein product [Caenorhabditis brenneri]
MTTPSAQAPQLTRRWSKVILENRTGSYFRFQVLHEYTGEQTDDSGYIEFQPNDKKTVFEKVYYNTGIFTTGVDNWKVHGTRLIEVGGENGKGIPLFGKFFIDGLPYATGHGLGASWKKHTLRAEDDGQETIIRVFQTEVQFISPSGRSTTTFNTLGENILPLSAGDCMEKENRPGCSDRTLKQDEHIPNVWQGIGARVVTSSNSGVVVVVSHSGAVFIIIEKIAPSL